MKPFLKSISLLFLVAVFTIPAAIIHGKLSNRWANPADFELFIKCLDAVPSTIGDWRLVDELPAMRDGIVKELGLKAHFNRVYENSSGKRVTCLLMLGDSGPLIRHPVEICYGNRAKQLINSYEHEFSGTGSTNHFRVHRYQPKSLLEDQFYIAYGFCKDGIWKAPESPRIEYGAGNVLYKIQVLTNADDTSTDKIPEHLAEFAMAISDHVWPK